jgi:hypothetical protein
MRRESLFGARFDFDPAGKDFSRPEKGLLPREKVFPVPKSLLVGVSRLFPAQLLARSV